MPIDPRAALISGLRDAADFLETNPQIPAPSAPITLHCFPKGDSDQEARARVDEIAAYLGSTIDLEPLPHGHYQTRISFGPVTYQAIAISTEARARYRAFDTYAGCVDPDPAIDSDPTTDYAIAT